MSEQTLDQPAGAIPPVNSPDRDSSPVARELDGHVAVLTMQHAPHNFLGTALFDALLDGIRWAAEQRARAVLLRSSLRNFCAGADVTLFDTAERGEAPAIGVVELLREFDSLPIPIVAAVQGVCLGGGLELALACDLIVAGESAKIGNIEASIGLNPLMGGIQRVTERAGAARAKEIAMLARRYDARTLERWNIINRVVADDQLAAVTTALAHELANGPTVAHASTKAIVSHAVSHGVSATDDAMQELQKGIWKSEDLKTGLDSLASAGPGAARFEGR
ncbi:enoyl-CoA hydratase/isomerase family protein [Mycobacterium montefiorense]|uniref:enoyl-CoA hydratase/isomerase family protein n=2 Tax=Mycobacterium montefiorense TaxID=154654 RepID=UPI0021F36B1C|nr:enoyl-CoA hydratase/isomerase family protein [Mycobacterium montefiorense]MCV7427484.1 enoyl-CoA hydratase/isomerase family protein [Mycobacterium montefiorense]